MNDLSCFGCAWHQIEMGMVFINQATWAASDLRSADARTPAMDVNPWSVREQEANRFPDILIAKYC
jgi:hypothetical protein